MSMDSLIGQNGGRPSEAELQTLARQMASQYPSLRDKPLEGLRDNYNSLVGFLRRRMYNITPPVSTKGRKKGYKFIGNQEKNGKEGSDKEEQKEKELPKNKNGEEMEVQRPKEVRDKEVQRPKEGGGKEVQRPKEGKGKEVQRPKEGGDKEVQRPKEGGDKEVQRPKEGKGKEVQIPKEGGDKEDQRPSDGEREIAVQAERGQKEKENDDQNSPADKATESLVAALKKCTRPSTSEQLIRLTIAERLKEIEKIPTKERLKYTLNTYKVFNHPESVIFNMYMQVPVELNEMKQKLEDLMTTSLDMLFEKNILNIPRSTIKTTDQKYFVALFHLPNLCGNKSAGKLKPGHYLVHVVKRSEMWNEVAHSHKGTSGPWILHNTIGSNTTTTLMEREDVLFKCKDAEEAILALLGLYYLGSLPYPPQITGPLLLLQHLVLEDKVHSGDLPTLHKARKEFASYKERSENHSLDSFF